MPSVVASALPLNSTAAARITGRTAVSIATAGNNPRIAQ